MRNVVYRMTKLTANPSTTATALPIRAQPADAALLLVHENGLVVRGLLQEVGGVVGRPPVWTEEHVVYLGIRLGLVQHQHLFVGAQHERTHDHGVVGGHNTAVLYLLRYSLKQPERGLSAAPAKRSALLAQRDLADIPLNQHQVVGI